MAADDVETGLYRNTNTGTVFAAQMVDGETVIFERGREITRLDRTHFWFNTTESTGPTYEEVA